MDDGKPGEWLVVSGVGGIGHMAIQNSKAMGLQVVAIDVTDDKLALAQELGATFTLNATTHNVVREVQGLTGGAHGVLVAAVSREAFAQGAAMLRRGGTCVLTGPPPDDFPLSIFDVVFAA